MVRSVLKPAHLIRCDRATVHRTKHRRVAIGLNGHFAINHYVDLLERRTVRSGAAAWKKLRESDPLVFRSAVFKTLKPEPGPPWWFGAS